MSLFFTHNSYICTHFIVQNFGHLNPGPRGSASLNRSLQFASAMYPHNYDPMDGHNTFDYHSASASSQDDGSDNSNTKKSKVYDDYQDIHGIRRPDPVRETRLVDDRPSHDPMYAMMRLNSASRADPHHVEWMFPPANTLSYPGGFEEVGY